MNFTRLEKRIDQKLEQEYQCMSKKLTENDSLFAKKGRLRSGLIAREAITIIKKYFTRMTDICGEIMMSYVGQSGCSAQKLDSLLQYRLHTIWKRIENDCPQHLLSQMNNEWRNLRSWRDKVIENAVDTYINEPAEKVKVLRKERIGKNFKNVAIWVIAAFVIVFITKYAEQIYSRLFQSQ